MPPKAKFTKEEIIAAALGIVREDGFQALTARALGRKLNSSPRPVFTVFQNMEEVQQEVLAAARKLYAEEYIGQGLRQKEMPAFKGVGMQYIQFALKEPRLFQLLFMSEQRESTDIMGILPIIDGNYPQILSSIQDAYSLSQEGSEWIYRHLWVYTHGIAVLCATNLCTFPPEKIGNMLTEVFTAIIKELKGGMEHD